MRIVLLDYGYKISKKKGRVVIFKEGEKILEVAPGNITEFIVNSRGVGFSSDVISFLLRHRVRVYFVRREKLIGLLNPIQGGGNINLRKKQFELSLKGETLELAYKIVEGKIRSQRNLLRYLLRRFRRHEIVSTAPRYIDSIEEVLYELRKSSNPDRDELINSEAKAARIYWGFWKHLFNNKYGFDSRRKRFEDPRDPINMALNLQYTLLTARVLTHLYVYGFDPYIGILHRDSPRRPALAMDIVEEFRVIAVDFPLIRHLLLDKPKPEEMTQDNRLTTEYKMKILKIFYGNLDNKITFKNRSLPLKDHIDLQITRLSKALQSDPTHYAPMIFR